MRDPKGGLEKTLKGKQIRLGTSKAHTQWTHNRPSQQGTWSKRNVFCLSIGVTTGIVFVVVTIERDSVRVRDTRPVENTERDRRRTPGTKWFLPPTGNFRLWGSPVIGKTPRDVSTLVVYGGVVKAERPGGTPSPTPTREPRWDRTTPTRPGGVVGRPSSGEERVSDRVRGVTDVEGRPVRPTSHSRTLGKNQKRKTRSTEKTKTELSVFGTSPHSHSGGTRVVDHTSSFSSSVEVGPQPQTRPPHGVSSVRIRLDGGFRFLDSSTSFSVCLGQGIFLCEFSLNTSVRYRYGTYRRSTLPPTGIIVGSVDLEYMESPSPVHPVNEFPS